MRAVLMKHVATSSAGWRRAGNTGKNGAPGGIRTPDQWLRKPLLYPAELRARCRTAAPSASAGAGIAAP